MKSATRMLWLDYWASKVDPNYNHSVIQHKKDKDGYWIAEVKLPYYDKPIVYKSGKLLVAVITVAREACQIVNKLMAEHPNLRVENKFNDDHWDMMVDENKGNYSIVQNEEYLLEVQNIQNCLTYSLSDQSKIILDLFSQWIGKNKPTYFHIFNKQVFGKENKEILKNADIFIKKMHKERFTCRKTFISGDSVVSFGFKMDIE